MIFVNQHISIPDSELELSFARSSGPGGQNVNKVSSKAVLRFAALRSTALPADVRARFLHKYRPRITGDGELIVTSQRYRDQGRNVADAEDKLRAMIAAVVAPPKKRRPTRPTKASVARRVQSKQAVSRKKQLRRRVGRDD